MIASEGRHHGTEGIARPYACAIRHIRPASPAEHWCIPDKPVSDRLAVPFDPRFQASDGGFTRGRRLSGRTVPSAFMTVSSRPGRHDMDSVQGCLRSDVRGLLIPDKPINPYDEGQVRSHLVLDHDGFQPPACADADNRHHHTPDGLQSPGQKWKVTDRPPPKSVLSLPAVA